MKPVTLCPTRGFIAVGTSNFRQRQFPGLRGAHRHPRRFLWENTYDLGGGQQDEGRALAELADGTGFVILGNNFSVNWQAVLMKIDCSGNVVWTRNYRWSALAPAMRGFDLIETRYGDSAFGTAAGDLAVAGYVASGGNEDAFLFRTRANGLLIWNQAYKLSGQERFNALTEATPSYGAPTGDLVAAGSVSVGTDSQALVARVDGNSGLYGGPNRCVSNYGNADDLQSFFAVIELQTAPYTGNIAFAGLTNGIAYSDDIYLLRTQANPCTPLLQGRLGDARPAAADRPRGRPRPARGAAAAGQRHRAADRQPGAHRRRRRRRLHHLRRAAGGGAAGTFNLLFGRVFGSQLAADRGGLLARADPQLPGSHHQRLRHRRFLEQRPRRPGRSARPLPGGHRRQPRNALQPALPAQAQHPALAGQLPRPDDLPAGHLEPDLGHPLGTAHQLPGLPLSLSLL